MAMEPCRECGTEVSTEAETCPSCGVQYPTEESGKRYLFWQFWAVVSAIVIVWALLGLPG